MSLGEETVVGSLGIKEVGRLASLEDSLFEGLLALLERLKGDMMGRLLEWSMREISEKAKPYSQERCEAANSCGKCSLCSRRASVSVSAESLKKKWPKYGISLDLLLKEQM